MPKVCARGYRENNHGDGRRPVQTGVAQAGAGTNVYRLDADYSRGGNRGEHGGVQRAGRRLVEATSLPAFGATRGGPADGAWDQNQGPPAVPLVLFHFPGAKHDVSRYWPLFGQFRECHGQGGAGASRRSNPHGWHTANPGHSSDDGAGFYQSRRFSRRSRYRRADLWLLASEVWRRSLRNRQDHHRGWEGAPDYRRDAAAVSFPRFRSSDTYSLPI